MWGHGSELKPCFPWAIRQTPAHCLSMGQEGSRQHPVHSLEPTALKKGIENCWGNSTIPAPCSWEQGNHCGKALSD